MKNPKTIYAKVVGQDARGTLMIGQTVDYDGCDEYRRVDECVWKQTNKEPQDLNDELMIFIDEMLAKYETGCGHFNMQQYGEFCPCGGKIVLEE